MARPQEDTPVDLKQLYQDLHALQVRAFGDDWEFNEDGTLTENSQDKAAATYGFLLAHECHEMLEETNWRKHKQKKQVDFAALRGELVDVFIYALDAASVLFPSYEEFLLAVKRKKEYNETRSDWKINGNNRRADSLTNNAPDNVD